MPFIDITLFEEIKTSKTFSLKLKLSLHSYKILFYYIKKPSNSLPSVNDLMNRYSKGVWFFPSVGPNLKSYCSRSQTGMLVLGITYSN